MEYKIVSAHNYGVDSVGDSISRQVNTLIQYGYIPYGNIVLTGANGSVHAMQAMVRYDEEDIIDGIQGVKERSK